jgi:hypothetical protein
VCSNVSGNAHVAANSAAQLAAPSALSDPSTPTTTVCSLGVAIPWHFLHAGDEPWCAEVDDEGLELPQKPGGVVRHHLIEASGSGALAFVARSLTWSVACSSRGGGLTRPFAADDHPVGVVFTRAEVTLASSG